MSISQATFHVKPEKSLEDQLNEIVTGAITYAMVVRLRGFRHDIERSIDAKRSMDKEQSDVLAYIAAYLDQCYEKLN